MDPLAWLALAIFTITISLVVANVMDSALIAMLGVAAMIAGGVITDVEPLQLADWNAVASRLPRAVQAQVFTAFELVDWNVIATLLGVWVLAGYFGKTGVPSWLSVRTLRLSRGNPGRAVMILSMLAGLLSMFVDNVVTILMLAPVALPLARTLALPVTPLILMIGFSANFMGTALLLGDLPPQMLHSVSGAEFVDFIWQFGRPSSFPILMVTFLITLAAMWAYGFRSRRGQAAPPVAEMAIDSAVPDRVFAAIAIGWFLLTVIAMAFRQLLDVELGVIALTGAVTLMLTLGLLGPRVKAPRFDEVLRQLDWRAIVFYVALFALVGGLENTGVLDRFAGALTPLFAENLPLGATLLYWSTVPVTGVVEHDAYILTFLHTIQDLESKGVGPWPLWWMLLWAGTLGSNLTVAGAPALFAALNICEREEGRKIPLREFLAWSVPFTAVAASVCYALGMAIWVLPGG